MAEPAAVLVAADEVDRSPAGVALIETVRWLVDHGAPVRALVFRRGDLHDDLADVVPTRVVADLGRWTVAGLLERACFALRLRRAGLARRARRLDIWSWPDGGVVHLHTVMAVQILRYLPPDRPPVTCRVSEDVHPLDWSLGPTNLPVFLDRVTRFLPVTHLGAGELLGLADADRVQRLPEAVVVDDDRLDAREGAAEVRRSLGIAPEAFVVGAYGSAIAPDPPDLYVLLASMLARRTTDRPVELVWMLAEETMAHWVEHDVERCGLADRVHVVPPSRDPSALVGACDALVHLTRTDDLGLAYLVGAAHRTPVVCFEGNELADVVGPDGSGGFVVPYLDVAAVADRVVALVNDPDLHRRLGDGAAANVAESHGIPRVAAELWRHLQEVAAP